MTNEQLAEQIAALGRIMERRFEQIESRMMAQFEYVIREIHRVDGKIDDATAAIDGKIDTVIREIHRVEDGRPRESARPKNVSIVEALAEAARKRQDEREERGHAETDDPEGRSALPADEGRA